MASCQIQGTYLLNKLFQKWLKQKKFLLKVDGLIQSSEAKIILIKISWVFDPKIWLQSLKMPYFCPLAITLFHKVSKFPFKGFILMLKAS